MLNTREVAIKLLKEQIQEQGFYDYIANNYTKWSKEELKNIILELDMIIYETLGSPRERKCVNQVIDNITK